MNRHLLKFPDDPSTCGRYSYACESAPAKKAKKKRFVNDMKALKEIGRFLFIFALVVTVMWLAWRGIYFLIKDIPFGNL